MRRGGWQQCAFNIFFNMFAASQIPYAFSQMGWLWGLIILSLVTISHWWSGHLLVDACNTARCYTWADLSEAACGRFGGSIVGALQTINFVVTGIVQTQGAASQWQQAFPEVPLCSWQWILVNSAPYLLFLQIPSLSGSSLLQTATFLTIVSTFWQLGVYSILIPDFGRYPYVCYSGQTVTTVLSAASNMVFTFGVKNMLPEMMREMADRREMHKAWTVANLIAMPLYWAVGLAGFWAFGVFNSGASLLLNFRDCGLVRSYLVTAAVLGYLPITFGQIVLFLKAELALGVLPTDFWSVSNPDVSAFPRIPPVLFRFMFRLTIVGCYIFFAEMFLGFGIQNFVSLVGAVAICAFSFYLPYVYYLCLHPQINAGKKAACIAGLVFGLALSGGGIYFTVKQIASMQTAGLFTGACHENSFFIGKYTFSGYAGDAGDGGYSSRKGPGSFYDTIYQATCGPHGSIECGQFNACCKVQGGHVVCPDLKRSAGPLPSRLGEPAARPFPVRGNLTAIV